MLAVRILPPAPHVMSPRALAVALVAAVAGAPAAAQVLFGELETKQHDVRGHVHTLSDRLPGVSGFEYDGQGPDAYFWVDEGGNGTEDGYRAPGDRGCGKVKLGKAGGDAFLVQMPIGMTVADLGGLVCGAKSLESITEGFRLTRQRLRVYKRVKRGSYSARRRRWGRQRMRMEERRRFVLTQAEIVRIWRRRIMRCDGKLKRTALAMSLWVG